MTRPAVTAVAAIYALSLVGLATVPRRPELPHSQADQQITASSIGAQKGWAAWLTGEVSVDAVAAPRR